MAETIKQEFYNGKEWIVVTSEVLYNSEGKPTGHYKELSREYITKLGIFDNQEVAQQAINDIVNLRNTLRDDFYLLFGQQYFELYRAYQYGYWNNIGIAVMDFFRKNNIIVDEYSKTDTTITFICHTRPDYTPFTIMLIGADDITQKVP